MATDMAERLAAIVSETAPTLKAAGFRKRRHAFNRTVADGMTHVLSFQAGAFDPPGATHIAGLTPDLYGKFTVNLGVHVPGMRDLGGRPLGTWINEYECHLRKRLGALAANGENEVWWDTLHPDAAVDVQAEIVEKGLPWLDRFPDADAVILAWRDHGFVDVGMHPAAPLDVAALMVSRGDRERAEAVARAYVESELSDHHREYVNTFLPTIGLDDLVAAVGDGDSD